MKKYLATMLAFLFSTQANANSHLSYAQRFHHHSHILDERRDYSVHLPANYAEHPGQHYPVVYLLDGESRMLQVAGIVEAFQSKLSAQTPEMIIVGIHNTDRMRDYTPTHYEKLPNGEQAPWREHTGGGRRFIDYMTQELMPIIDKNYRTAKPNVLIGHSLGGLLTLDALAAHDDFFQGFIAIDPSLWFDYPNYYQRLVGELNKPFTAPAALYLAIANNPFTPSLGRDSSHRDRLLALKSLVEPKKGGDFLMHSEYFEQADHHSVYHLAVYQGLQWIFAGYSIPTDPQILQLKTVKARYQALNQRLGSQLTPPYAMLEALEKKAKHWPTMQLSTTEIQAIKQYFYPSTHRD
ncbi:alpha/beta hydrolase [Vibrio palustris]|uniref:Ferri-bacillibactin esterase BesA n=1 Tax=Vibrio palustris TaxID=1918946 RepID=A0A1R4B0P4_9VIBR|nr:alpha/beta hydrolase-fold protein [Vibrio palustris]SJL82490.1 Ferri-bacillibactin esterase BesA [Vibrio palustris]